ncbi:MAG: hypothetical protein DI534_15420 [Leifsonia xyli]|nr:MAG: hypothetical protein DI534_15420 [Leifsonia xyli]
MIIRSSYVKDDPNRVAHLLNSRNNKRVVEHSAFDRGCPGDLGGFLAFSSALTAAHPKARITLGHLKISPAHVLSRRQLLRTIALIRRENRISRNHPMRLIEHDKGDRPPHYHLLFSAVDPATGRVLSSKANYARDELVSRRLEIEFGEALTPGPRVQRNAADLRARGRDREAQILEAYEPVRRRGKDSEADRQQAARTKLPLMVFRSRLLAAVTKGLRSGSLPRALAAQGFSVAIGNRSETLMAVHDETGMALPFAASVRIASGGGLEVAPSAIAQLRHDAPPLPQSRREGAARALKRAERALDREIDRGRFEAAADGEFDSIFGRMRRAREKAEADSDKAGQVQSQAAMRRATLATRRETARMRERRIDRAFRAARILQSRRARKVAFALAAGGMLLTGMGLSVALGAGFVATVAVRGYGDALRAQARGLIAQRRAAVTRSRPLPVSQAAPVAIMEREAADTPRAVPLAPASSRKTREPASFDFALIGKSRRVLAAMALESLLGGAIPIARDALKRALGEEAFAGLVSLARDGSVRQRKLVRSWDGGRSMDAFAAETALRRAGEGDAAKTMAVLGRQRRLREHGQVKGRD